jgi:hypothetical protein
MPPPSPAMVTAFAPPLRCRPVIFGSRGPNTAGVSW